MREIEEHARDAASAAIVVERPGMSIAIFALFNISALVVEELTMAHRLLTCLSDRVH